MRPLPLLLALVVGAALGVLIGRMTADAPAPQIETASASATPAGAAGSEDVIVFAPPASSSPVDLPPVPRSQLDAPPVAAPAPAPADDANDADAGHFQRIDAGPVFNQQFANSEKQGMRDVVLEAHRAMEREPRDDSWSYPLEAEIENSLVEDTSMGNFRREHLECRSSSCEIRLSAEGAAQIEALRQWTSDIQRYPWASRMLLSSSSSVVDENRMDALLILTKPPTPPDAN